MGKSNACRWKFVSFARRQISLRYTPLRCLNFLARATVRKTKFKRSIDLNHIHITAGKMRTVIYEIYPFLFVSAFLMRNQEFILAILFLFYKFSSRTHHDRDFKFNEFHSVPLPPPSFYNQLTL